MNDLPNELIHEIIKYLPRSSLPQLARVSKKLNPPTKEKLYKKIVFESVGMRDRFFKALENQFHEQTGRSSPTRTTPPRSARRGSTSPNSAPLLRRRASLRANSSLVSKMIHSLDFGLRPRTMMPNEPPLPCSKPISPNRMDIDSPLSVPRITTLDFGGLGNSSSGSSWDLTTIAPQSVKSKSPKALSAPKLTLELQQRQSNAKKRLETEEEPVYGKWQDRFVSQYISLISTYLPNLKELSLCGCHLNSSDFQALLPHLTQLEHLDISYSTLKSDGTSAITRFCRSKLQSLNLSGIFKFGRNKPQILVSIVMNCTALHILVIKDCPEIYPETREEIDSLSKKLKIISE